MIYLDNNATTKPFDSVVDTIVENNTTTFLNASSATDVSEDIMNRISEFTKRLSMDLRRNDSLFCIYTSGATEANSLVFKSTVESHLFLRNAAAVHIVVSSYEHASIIDCLRDMQRIYKKRLEYTMVDPDDAGYIQAKDIVNAIKGHTILVSVMHSNNELPVYNDIDTIALAVKKKNPDILVHTDATQTFAKVFASKHVDAITFSGHKFNGPKGIGGLLMDKTKIVELGLPTQISGEQQYGLRGGTINHPLIFGMQEAYNNWSVNKDKYIKKMSSLVKMIHEQLDLQQASTDPGQGLWYFGSKDHHSTVFMCVVSRPDICNKVIRNKLLEHGIIVSIGSACGAATKEASHVLKAIHATSDAVKKGVLRVSVGYDNTEKDISEFVYTIKSIIE